MSKNENKQDNGEGSDASTCSVSNSDTPETYDSTERVIKAGISPIIDYCYALDMQKMEIERNEAREQAEIFRDAVGKALGAVKFTWEL